MNHYIIKLATCTFCVLYFIVEAKNPQLIVDMIILCEHNSKNYQAEDYIMPKVEVDDRNQGLDNFAIMFSLIHFKIILILSAPQLYIQGLFIYYAIIIIISVFKNIYKIKNNGLKANESLV